MKLSVKSQTRVKPKSQFKCYYTSLYCHRDTFPKRFFFNPITSNPIELEPCLIFIFARFYHGSKHIQDIYCQCEKHPENVSDTSRKPTRKIVLCRPTLCEQCWVDSQQSFAFYPILITTVRCHTLWKRPNFVK